MLPLVGQTLLYICKTLRAIGFYIGQLKIKTK